MATLKKDDLPKRGNDETLVDKFFGLNNKVQTFLADDGQFQPVAMTLVENGVETEPYEPHEKNRRDECLARIQRMAAANKPADKIMLTGKFLNTNAIKTLSLTKFQKTEEFGGQTGGKRINLGIKFENDFLDSLQKDLACEKNTINI